MHDRRQILPGLQDDLRTYTNVSLGPEGRLRDLGRALVLGYPLLPLRLVLALALGSLSLREVKNRRGQMFYMEGTG